MTAPPLPRRGSRPAPASWPCRMALCMTTHSIEPRRCPAWCQAAGQHPTRGLCRVPGSPPALPLAACPQLHLLPVVPLCPQGTRPPRLGGQLGGALHAHPASPTHSCWPRAFHAPPLGHDGWTHSSATAVLISRVIKRPVPAALLPRSPGMPTAATRAGSGGAVQQQNWYLINKLGCLSARLSPLASTAWSPTCQCGQCGVGTQGCLSGRRSGASHRCCSKACCSRHRGRHRAGDRSACPHRDPPGWPQAAAGGVVKPVKYEMPVYPRQGF